MSNVWLLIMCYVIIIFHIGNAGCDGGWMDIAFYYVQTNGGIDTENSYPYEARVWYNLPMQWNNPLFRIFIKHEFGQLSLFKCLQDEPCRYKSQTSGASDYGFLDVAKADEEALQAATAEIGPISVAIDATHESFQQYRCVQRRMFKQSATFQHCSMCHHNWLCKICHYPNIREMSSYPCVKAQSSTNLHKNVGNSV